MTHTERLVTQAHGNFWSAVPKWWSIVKIWFTGTERWKARGFAVASVALSVCSTLLMVHISYAQRNFSTALSEKHVSDFYNAVRQFVGIIAIAAPLFALAEFVQARLKLAWRLYFTDLLVNSYFTDTAYYRIQHMSGVDNPDQRLCQDIASFVSNSTDVINIIVKKVLSCVAFAGVLWSVSPTLVAVLFGYAIFGTWITTSVFGRRLMRLQFQVLKQEGDLRFALVRVRENCESIAFYRGHQPEAACVKGRLHEAVSTHKQQIKWASFLEIWRNVYTYATILVPSLVTAPKYFAGEIQFGVVTQASFAFGRIESALSVIIASLESLSGLAAETERLHDLIAALHHNGGFLTSKATPLTDGARLKKDDGASRDDSPTAAATDVSDKRLHEQQALLEASETGEDGWESGPQILRTAPAEDDTVAAISVETGQSVSRRVVLRLSHLTVHTPGAVGTSSGLMGGCCIADDLNLQLHEGQSLLVVGPSGCGKSSLLRVLSGLWTRGSGSIACLPRESIMFLPQKPYMTLGSLRQQLLFPASESSVSDKTLLQLAYDVNLPRVAEAVSDLEKEDNWAEIFSLGEQQRIAFLRLLCCKPSLAFLDEATSALDAETERKLYGTLKATCVSYVSVGHRMQLVEHHSHVLKWIQPGKWLLMPAKEFSASLAQPEASTA